MSDLEQIDTSDPAFPLVSPHGLFTYRGMSLRDWFAGQALAGLSATDNYDSKTTCVAAYELADLMIETRNVKQ